MAHETFVIRCNDTPYLDRPRWVRISTNTNTDQRAPNGNTCHGTTDSDT